MGRYQLYWVSKEVSSWLWHCLLWAVHGFLTALQISMVSCLLSDRSFCDSVILLLASRGYCGKILNPEHGCPDYGLIGIGRHKFEACFASRQSGFYSFNGHKCTAECCLCHCCSITQVFEHPPLLDLTQFPLHISLQKAWAIVLRPVVAKRSVLGMAGAFGSWHGCSFSWSGIWLLS